MRPAVFRPKGNGCFWFGPRGRSHFVRRGTQTILAGAVVDGFLPLPLVSRGGVLGLQWCSRPGRLVRPRDGQLCYRVELSGAAREHAWPASVLAAIGSIVPVR